MKQTAIIFILSFNLLLILSCIHKNDNVTVNNTNTSKSRISKMTGIWNWYGTETVANLSVDTTYNVADTFGWVVIDSSTIVKQNTTYYGFDTLRLLSSNDSEFIFYIFVPNGHTSSFQRVTYNYKNNTMHYEYHTSNPGGITYENLYTP